MNPPDRVDLLQRAVERVTSAEGVDRRGALEGEARSLAYGAAKAMERTLKRVENVLVSAALKAAPNDVEVGDVIWLVRRSILIGLAEAEAELDPAWGVIHWQG